MKRGEIWWATLPPPIDSGPGGRRPVVIIQDDEFNRSGIRTVIVAIVTTNLKLATAPGNVLLPAYRTNLEEDSVANVSQLYTASKSSLTDYVGDVPDELMQAIEKGLIKILSLA
jgi:mRNA interferase MazF